MLQLREALHPFFTDPIVAVQTAVQRRRDPRLMAEISLFTRGQPEHLDRARPALYLSRFLATPSHETLRCYDLAKESGLELIIGEDHGALFYSVNTTKKSLLRPLLTAPRGRSVGTRRRAIFADVAKAEGVAFGKITTIEGDTLKDFHHKLIKKIAPDVVVGDETNWVNTVGRGNLARQYDQLFAGLIAGNVMVEGYYPSDLPFVEDVVLPAFDRAVGRFGLAPLVADLFDIAGDHPEEVMSGYDSHILEVAQCGS